MYKPCLAHLCFKVEDGAVVQQMDQLGEGALTEAAGVGRLLLGNLSSCFSWNINLATIQQRASLNCRQKITPYCKVRFLFTNLWHFSHLAAICCWISVAPWQSTFRSDVSFWQQPFVLPWRYRQTLSSCQVELFWCLAVLWGPSDRPRPEPCRLLLSMGPV